MKLFVRLMVVVVIALLGISCACDKYKRFDEDRYTCTGCIYTGFYDHIEKKKLVKLNSTSFEEKISMKKPLIDFEYDSKSDYIFVSLYKKKYYKKYLCDEYDVYDTAYCYPNKVLSIMGFTFLFAIFSPNMILNAPLILLHFPNNIELPRFSIFCKHCVESKKVKTECNFIKYTGQYHTEKEKLSDGEFIVLIGDYSEKYIVDKNGKVKINITPLIIQSYIYDREIEFIAKFENQKSSKKIVLTKNQIVSKKNEIVNYLKSRIKELKYRQQEYNKYQNELEKINKTQTDIEKLSQKLENVKLF